MAESARDILARLSAYLTHCDKCNPDIWREVERLEAALGADTDPLEDARHALLRAEQHLDRRYHGKHGEAIRHEIVSAAVSVGRALALRG